MANQKKEQSCNSKKSKNCKSRSKSEDDSHASEDKKKEVKPKSTSPLSQSTAKAGAKQKEGTDKAKQADVEGIDETAKPQERIVFPDVVPNTTFTNNIMPMAFDRPYAPPVNGGSAAKTKSVERGGNIAGIIILPLIAAFIIFIIIAASTGGLAQAQSGSLNGDKNIRYGRDGAVTYDLGDTKLKSNDQIVWYVDGKEVQRKPYSDKSALTYEYNGGQIGKQRIKVVAGNKAFCECDVTVSKPKLNVTVGKLTAYYGDEFASPNYKVTGFAKDDSQSNYPEAKVYYTKYGATEKAAPKNVGIYSARLRHNYPGTEYDLEVKEGTVEIMPRKVTVTGKISKVYDGKNYIENPSLAVTGVLDGDDVSVRCDRLYLSDKNVGENKQAGTYNIVLTGEDAANYQIGEYQIDVKVTPKQLSVENLTAGDKVFDGTDSVSFDGNTRLSGVAEGDIVEIGEIDGYYANSQIGQNKSVIIKNISLVGRDSSNYSLGKYPEIYSSISRFASSAKAPAKKPAQTIENGD